MDRIHSLPEIEGKVRLALSQSASASMMSFRYVSSHRSVVTVARDGTTRRTVILTTYVEDGSLEYETLRDAIQRYLKTDSTVDSIEVHFPEKV